MKIVSWNVNGLKSIISKGLLGHIQKWDADIVCLGETKSPKVRPEFELDGYHIYWNDAKRPGYSGTAIFSKKKPLNVKYGLGYEEHDQEGRVITAEYKNFFLVNVYTPNAKRELTRLPYRYKEWDPLFLEHCVKLDKKKPVIFCGDLNVAHTEIDLKNPKSNKNTHGFTKEEREGFDNMIEAGFIDSFRKFESRGDHYTWWSYMGNCRARNVGWRIDYVLVSQKLDKKLKSACIHTDIMGSDHCPVEAIIK